LAHIGFCSGTKANIASGLFYASCGTAAAGLFGKRYPQRLGELCCDSSAIGNAGLSFLSLSRDNGASCCSANGANYRRSRVVTEHSSQNGPEPRAGNHLAGIIARAADFGHVR
jgi:hypothetical protein